MTLKEEALQAVEDVPANSLPMLIKFARFLKSSYDAELEEAKEKTDRKPRRHGRWVKGKIWMSDDFNDPMDFVSEDEMRVLEAMREAKKTTPQEAAV